DITQGLPRVEELFEARKPKGLAIITEIAGTANLNDTKKKREIIVTNRETGESKAYLIPYGSRIKVADGAELEAGDELTEGSVNPHDILRIKGLRAVQDYMIQEVQRVYRLQGVEINDKHIEVIVRQMLKKIRIEESGDTEFLPGTNVDRLEFEDVNEALEAEGKEPATGEQIIMGITKASLATNSFLSAASFQETTKVLTEAAIKGKVDPLVGLKENVIIGKPIPAGTGLSRYHQVGLTYKGQSVNGEIEEQLPDFAPSELREIESLLPQPQDWSLDDNYMNGYSSYFGGSSFRGGHAQQLSDEDARLYLYDDLGVSQRWANKFSEAGIDTVADLVGYTENELLRIEGIGAKALEELKTGLKEHELGHLLEDDLSASSDDMSQLLDMVFSPDDTILIGGDQSATYSNDGEEMLGEALPSRSYHRDLSELDALLGGLGDLGFGETSEDSESEGDEEGEDEE
ncbi:DNA-directed RNA polymerase subunit alpha C-terminal domain-containing protein, partial [uncultured Slackia sp.]|uniref:DNA-directed RNA polymerase subunit alpha C-terminal domain-containing protein n=1 Tax=uncultured Slackia sp. TaxID=665903 RepID=UPI002605F541